MLRSSVLALALVSGLAAAAPTPLVYGGNEGTRIWCDNGSWFVGVVMITAPNLCQMLVPVNPTSKLAPVRAEVTVIAQTRTESHVLQKMTFSAEDRNLSVERPFAQVAADWGGVATRGVTVSFGVGFTYIMAETNWTGVLFKMTLTDSGGNVYYRFGSLGTTREHIGSDGR